MSLGIFNIGDLPDAVQKDFVVADTQSLGNTFWMAGTGLTEAATRFCFANTVASSVDGLTATLGNALTNSGLIVVVVIAAAFLIIVRLRRGDRSAKQQIAKILTVLVLFAVMVKGAENTKTVGNSVSFGFGSPGWVLTHVYGAVSTVASAPAAALAGAADNLNFGGTVQQKIDKADPLSCGNYVNNLRTLYRDAYGSSASNNIVATVPLALDAMWEQSGLTTYAYSQFGANNDYASLVYCRLLEANANISPAVQVAITEMTPGASEILRGTQALGGSSGTSMAWTADQNIGANPNDTVDEAMVGWAACQTKTPGYTPMEWSSTTGLPVTSEWTEVKDPNASRTSVNASVCRNFFTENEPTFNPQSTALEWADNPGAVSAAAYGPGYSYSGFANYVDNLHGTSNGSSEMLSVMFLISSTVDLIVFGVMAGAVLVAKFSLLFLMAFAAFFFLISLWPGAAASSRLAGLAKHAFSMILFTTGAQLILSIVAITTSIIMDTGSAIAGQGSFLSLLWMGIAPIAAIFIVHHLFKQVLKAPSPFKMSSALAWGAASSGLGAGAVAGLDRIASRKAVWGGSKKAIGTARSSLAGNRQKKDSMQPMGSGAQVEPGRGVVPKPGTNTAAIPSGTTNGAASGAVPAVAAVAAGATTAALPAADRRRPRRGGSRLNDDDKRRIEAYKEHRLGRGGAVVESDGQSESDKVIRTKHGRVVGAPIGELANGVDTRSMAERLHDDRILRRHEIRSGRAINRNALAARASTNALNRAADAGSSNSRRVLGYLANPETIRGRTLQRIGERTQLALEELRARPLHSLASSVKKVAKTGALGVGAAALVATPPLLGVAAGAYALRRVHKRHNNLNADQTRTQRHISAYRDSLHAGRQQPAAHSATQKTEPDQQAPKQIESGGNSNEPPPRDAPHDLDEPVSEWQPPPEPQRPKPAPKANHPRPVPKPTQPQPNQAPVPSHLVNNRRPNQPSGREEVPPEVRQRFDEQDESSTE